MRIELCPPPKYDGHPDLLKDFIFNIKLHYKMYPEIFNQEDKKIAFFVSYLSGTALCLARHGLETNTSLWDSLEKFLCYFKSIFQDPIMNLKKTNQILLLKQNGRLLHEYKLDFLRLCSDCVYTNTEKIHFFNNGLDEEVKNAMLSALPSADLNQYMEKAAKIDFYIKNKTSL